MFLFLGRRDLGGDGQRAAGIRDRKGGEGNAWQRARGGLGNRGTEDWRPAPGAAVDLTLLADLRLAEPQRFFLTCVSGEAGPGPGAEAWGPPLLLEKDDRIVRTPRPGQPPHLLRNGSHRVTLRGFSQPSDLVGVFSCVGGAGAGRTRVLYVHNSPGGESGSPGRDGRGAAVLDL